MEVPSLRHRVTNDRYQKSVTAAVAVEVAEAVAVPEEVDETEEGEGVADEVRR